MRYSFLRIICCISIIILLLIEAIILHNEGFSVIDTYKTEGKVVIHQEESVPRRKITEIIVKDGMLYILYDSCGLVNVYTVDGTFQYGLQVSTGSNDRGDIAFAGEKLLIKARGSIIYVFDGSTFDHYVALTHTEYQQMTDSAREYKELETYFSVPKSHEYQGWCYKVSDSGEDLLVQNESGLYQPVEFLPQRSAWVYDILLIICALVVLTFWSPRSQKKG